MPKIEGSKPINIKCLAFDSKGEMIKNDLKTVPINNEANTINIGLK